ncbi:longevity-assurance domain-containing protein, putative [Eimeria maxima]|uniref:Longevity-assurance domain-containing protein, putative n=1 Tax=Eimeria maxima TaxID=5804 RepID=U6MFP1_EIMMA|nr:longevity-assurance domain-containing protein, putative [Eimeria maxima]CDJ60480.1 longevity-assurance domain-containing protein, putative [Eimeria maxima]
MLVLFSYFCSYWKVGVILHIYWFWCIIKMVIGLVTAVRNGSREDCEDVRSEDEDDGDDDEQEEEEKKKQENNKKDQ